MIYQVLRQILNLLSNRGGEASAEIAVNDVLSPHTPQVANTMLDATAAQQRLRISRATYYRFVKSKKLVPRKLGSRHYYYPEDLEEQLKESKRKGRI